MKKSLLLHALSLKDRILEPNQLPLAGQVWAYDKSLYTKEEIVGNCISMLSLLGMHDASIQWNNDILAFDATWEKRTFTIILSLQDDSLASEYFYFLGVWEVLTDYQQNKAEYFASQKPWEDEDLLKPDISYSVIVSSDPMTQETIQNKLGRNVFSQSLYNGTYRIDGTTQQNHITTGSFYISPETSVSDAQDDRIRHLLYSLRNLMALTAKGMVLYDQEQHHSEVRDIQQQVSALAGSSSQSSLTAETSEHLIREINTCYFNTEQVIDTMESAQNNMQSLHFLFDSITSELSASTPDESRPLFQRMQLPILHSETLLGRHIHKLGRMQKSLEMMQHMLNSRLLIRQLKSDS